MKQTLFLFLLFPLIVSAQDTKGFFEISKDAFYFEQMDKWKSGVYSDPDCKFTTVVDNDSIFSFDAQNHFFSELYQLTLNPLKKIKKIEIFFSPTNGELNYWFPYKYPININNVYKDVGNPSSTKENIIYEPAYNPNFYKYKFKKYYKWNNVLFRETSIVLEVANGIVQIPNKNKRKKEKNYTEFDFGYVSYTPKSEGLLSENDITFTTSVKISQGVKKLWFNDKYELTNFLGQARFDTTSTWVNSELFPYFFHLTNPNDPKQYFKSFVFLATMVYGINIGEVIQDTNQKFTFTTLPDGVLARAVGMEKECCVEILIDLKSWNKSSFLDKLFIMYHELGHDVFGLKHSDGIRLMTTERLEIDNASVLGEMIHEMFMAVLKKQKG